MSEYLAIDHPRFRRVDRDLFIKTVTPDCMSFTCRLVKDGDRVKLDACCQYGVDCDLGERDGILAHAEQLHSILAADARDQPWFDDKVVDDVDFPSGKYVRTRTHAGGCLFLSHDGRGCAVHRASVEGDWDFRGIKPHVCRLFPVSYDHDSIVLSDDYDDYSCAQVADAPTLYRVARADLGEFFGDELIVALDAVEVRVVRDAVPIAS